MVQVVSFQAVASALLFRCRQVEGDDGDIVRNHGMADSPAALVERHVRCIGGILLVSNPTGLQIARYRSRQYQEQLPVYIPIGGLQCRVGLTLRREWNPTVSIPSHCEESVP
jgi:hypothetical protein